MFFAQLMEGWGPHASLISSLQAVVLSHLPPLSAIAEEETKTPAPSATAANVTTALRVIVEPPYGRSNPKSDFGDLPPRLHRSDMLVKVFLECTAVECARGRMRMAGGEKPYFDHRVPASTLEPGGRD